MYTRAECFVCVKDLSLHEYTRYIAKIGLHLHDFVLLWYMIPSIFCSLNLSLDFYKFMGPNFLNNLENVFNILRIC